MIDGVSKNLGTRAIYGIVNEPGTMGQLTAWEAAMWAGLLGSIMISLLVVDVHRRGEYTGISELNRSTGIRKIVPWAAATFTGLITSLTIGLGSTGILLGLMLHIDELTVEGALAFGVSLSLMTTGCMLLAQALLLFVSDGAVLGRTALLGVAAAYVLRIVADTQEVHWLNWLTPLGWREVIGPYSEDAFDRAGILTLVCIAATVVIGFDEWKREYASGFLPRRSGSLRTRSIHGPIHLRFLLTRRSAIGWTAVVAFGSAFLLALSGEMQEIIGASEVTAEVFRDLLGGTNAFAAFIAYVCQMIAIMISAAGIQHITSYRREEIARTVDLQRSTGVRRWGPLGVASFVALLSIAFLTAVMHGAGAAGLATQDTTLHDDYGSLAWAAWSMLASAVFFLGIATSIVGWFPRATPWAWAPLAAAAVVTLMGEMSQLPEWAIDLSPLSHPATGTDSDWQLPALLAGTGLVLVVIGLAGSQRREIL